MKNITILAIAVLVSLPVQPQEVESAQRLVATINGEKITVEKFNYLWEALSPELQQNYELSGGGRIGFLDNYIERRLIIQEAIKSKFDQRKDVMHELDNVRDTALFNKYVAEVIAADVIPEPDLRAYYEANVADFRQAAKRKARQIMATPVSQPVWNTAGDDAKNAEEARKKLEALRSQMTGDVSQFADLASKFGEDSTARSGGDLGWVTKGTLAVTLDAALFKLEVGEVSEVVETEFGFHVIMCEGIQPAGIKPFEEVRSEIAKKLVATRQAEVITALRALTRDLRGVSAVAIYRENL